LSQLKALADGNVLYSIRRLNVELAGRELGNLTIKAEPGIWSCGVLTLNGRRVSLVTILTFFNGSEVFGLVAFWVVMFVTDRVMLDSFAAGCVTFGVTFDLLTADSVTFGVAFFGTTEVLLTVVNDAFVAFDLFNA
jgi:hypothetical protein